MASKRPANGQAGDHRCEELPTCTFGGARNTALSCAKKSERPGPHKLALLLEKAVIALRQGGPRPVRWRVLEHVISRRNRLYKGEPSSFPCVRIEVRESSSQGPQVAVFGDRSYLEISRWLLLGLDAPS